MDMLELMNAVGDENIGVQSLDVVAVAFSATKTKGNRITFETEKSFGSNGMNSFGVVFWFDRDKCEALMTKTKAKGEVMSLNKLLAELSDSTYYQTLDSSIQSLKALKACNRVTFVTKEGMNSLGFEKLGLVTWFERDLAKKAMAKSQLQVA